MTARRLDRLGFAMTILYIASLAGLAAALWFGDGRSALLFIGGMVGAGATMIAISLFAERIGA